MEQSVTDTDNNRLSNYVFFFFLLRENKNHSLASMVSEHLVPWTGEPLTVIFLKTCLLSVSDSRELSMSVS